MTPERAFSLGLRPSDVSIRSQSDRFAGAWVVFGCDRPVTQSHDLYAILRWVKTLAAVERAERPAL